MLPNFDLNEQDSQDLRVIMRGLTDRQLISIADRRHHEMNLIVVHNHNVPLDLAKIREILETGPTHPNWACLGHDLHGINQKLDRRTFKLTDHFSPRLARPEPPKRPIDYTPRLDKQRRG